MDSIDTAREFFQGGNRVLSTTQLKGLAGTSKTIALFKGRVNGNFHLVSHALTVVTVDDGRLEYKTQDNQSIAVPLDNHFAADGKAWNEAMKNPNARRIVRP